jgi:uncharacterized repeat protein (TIGR02543 family)
MPREIKIITILIAIFITAPLFAQEVGFAYRNVQGADEYILSENTALAYDSINNHFLWVSVGCPDGGHRCNCPPETYNIYGTIVDHDGTIISSRFLIADNQFRYDLINVSEIFCDVKFDHVNQRFLVVWPDYRNGKAGIFGQFINTDGRLIGAGGSDGSNFCISQVSGYSRYTDLAFDPVEQRFLVVWDTFLITGDNSQVDIHGRFINSRRPNLPLSGAKQFSIAPSMNFQASPAVAFDRHNRNFLVVWKDLGMRRDKDDRYIMGQMIRSNGQIIGSETGFAVSAVVSGGGIFEPELAWESRTHRFLVVWTKRGHPTDLTLGSTLFMFGRIVNPNGTLYGEPGAAGEIFFNSCTPYGTCVDSYHPNLAFDPSRGDFLLLFSWQAVAATFRVSPEGVVTEPMHRIHWIDDFRSVWDKNGLAYNSSCGNFMISLRTWMKSKYKDFWFLGDSQCPGMAEVKTVNVGEISGSGAVCRGEVVMDGGLEVTARGMCWSTEPGPDLSDSHTVDGKGMGYFKSVLTGLLPNTKYYVRAYATNSAGAVFGGERTFTTKKAFNVTFKVESGGSLVGESPQEVLPGGACSPVKAVATEGFFFTGWTGDGGFVSTLDNPLVVKNVSGNMNIVAGFSSIHLRGERIAARDQALKNDIGEIEISCEAINASLPLVFKLYRSIDGAGRQLITQFNAADVADGSHHVLDTSLESRTKYEYVIEVLNYKGEQVGKSSELIL